MSSFRIPRFFYSLTLATLVCGGAFDSGALAQTTSRGPATPAAPPAAPGGRGAGGAPATAASGAAPAKAPAKPPVRKLAKAAKPRVNPNDPEANPIRCSWRTDKGAVRVAERFTLTVTCGLLETDRMKAVVGRNQFEPTAMQVAPFEVIGGVRHDDVVSPPWRYFQYDYTLRLITDRFGQDVTIPAVKLTYTTQVGAANAEGRDRSYTMPAMPIRVVSLVPQGASDIRDVRADTFGDIETQRFRSSIELAAATLLFGFAAVFVGLAVVRAISQRRQSTASLALPMQARPVLRGCLQGLDEVRSEVSRSGWTPQLTGRALSILRIAGAAAVGHPLLETPADESTQTREGQLLVKSGLLKPKRTLLSASTTAALIDQRLQQGNGRGPQATHRPALEGLRDSLGTFSAARYAREGRVDRAALDKALEAGTSAVRRLRSARLRTAAPRRPVELGTAAGA